MSYGGAVDYTSRLPPPPVAAFAPHVQTNQDARANFRSTKPVLSAYPNDGTPVIPDYAPIHRSYASQERAAQTGSHPKQQSQSQGMTSSDASTTTEAPRQYRDPTMNAAIPNASHNNPRSYASRVQAKDGLNGHVPHRGVDDVPPVSPTG
ncbi:hypothetical protein LTS18_008025, partial [Coniosporium uncinatum]